MAEFVPGTEEIEVKHNPCFKKVTVGGRVGSWVGEGRHMKR